MDTFKPSLKAKTTRSSNFAACCLVIATLCFPLSQSARAEAMLEIFNVNWSDLIDKMPEIAEAGYTSLWLPPPAKGGSVFSIGYDQFDPFDLGDKNQRGTVATHWGTKDQLLKVVETAHRFGIRVYFDNIVNHRAFDVPGYNANTPTNLYPGLRPQDFHLQTVSGGFFANWPSVQDYNNQFDVQYESLGGLVDLATEPGSINGNFGNTLGSTTPKISFIRHPNIPEYYMDPALPALGGPWHPFNGTNGVPVTEDVNAYMIRAAMWTLYTTKCDGFRLDAVKHVPSGFFGDSTATWNGYTGGIQAIFDWVHGYGTNVTDNGYMESNDSRNSCFDSETPRNDALLFGEHLGEPPTFSEYLARGMRLLNAPLRDQMNSALGGNSSLSGMDGRDFGAFSPAQSVMFAQSQDAAGCCATHRDLQNAYYFMHEGIPEIYSDGYNQSGPPNYFPNPPHANYLGEFNDVSMPEICYQHNQLARGGTRGRWSDNNIVAFERYDYRDVTGGDAFTNADSTVVLFAMNDNYGNPGDITFSDGVARTSDGYYTCGQGANVRSNGMRVGFPPGSILSQLASSANAANRACPKLLVHNATTDKSQAIALANAASAVNRLIYVNAAVPPGGGAVEMTIPSGGWVMYGYQWPEASRANVYTNAIILSQGGARVPTMKVYRHDGVNGDSNFNPTYPFKMRGSIDPTGAIIGGQHVSNLTYTIDIPVLTNASFDLALRCDASAVNILAKMDGGLDLNSQMSLGPASGDRRDNRPGYASDVFLGYEQAGYQFRYGPEKFAARDIARDNVTSLGAETYYYTVGGTNTAINGGGNGANVITSTPTWVYHDPSASNSVAGGSNTPTQRVPLAPASGQSVDVWLKVGYNYKTNHCFLYYTIDGSNPEGTFGIGKSSTQVVPGIWVSNDTVDTLSDWFKATIPAQADGVQVRYKAAFYQEDITSISDSDSSKLYGLTQFAITNFNPVTATVWLHNDLNTNNTAVGLTEGFHIVRARCFLPRSGKSGVYNTFLQTFYYDAGLPSGAIAFPATDGSTINTTNYGVVVRAKFGHGRGLYDRRCLWPNHRIGPRREPRRHNHSAIPEPPAGVSLHLQQRAQYRHRHHHRPLEKADLSGPDKSRDDTCADRQYTSPAQVVQLVNPATNGNLVVLGPDDGFSIHVCYTASLTLNDSNLFSIVLNGALASRSNYIFLPGGCTDGTRRSLYYVWSGVPPGTNLIQVIYTNGFTLSDSKTLAVARPGDSDNDGMSDYQEMIAGTDPYNSNSVLRINALADGNQLIVWDGVSNINYQVLATTNLNYPMAPISPVVPGNGGPTFYFDSAPDAAGKFYRLQVVP